MDRWLVALPGDELSDGDGEVARNALAGVLRREDAGLVFEFGVALDVAAFPAVADGTRADRT
jgi:hypothetical protein